MSFCSDVKDEICTIENENPCCDRSEAYGLALFARAFSPSQISFVTENEAAAEKYVSLISKVCGVSLKINHSPSGKISVNAETPEERQKIRSAFGHDKKELSLRLNRANIENECCQGAFLRGVFLACGGVTDPEKDYHGEFAVQRMNLCSDLDAFLSEVLFEPKSTQRKGYNVLYTKDSESVEDLLTFMGATNSSLKLMSVKMLKDVRNNVNRKLNFETANISRTVAASLQQVEAIAKIRRTRGIESLPEDLQELAILREENPEMSLRELGENLSVPISRSGVNHRLERIMEFARYISQEGEEDVCD